jgi:hypothetical protein
MSPRAKGRSLALGISAIAVLAACVIGMAHRATVPKSGVYKGEQIVTRLYYGSFPMGAEQWVSVGAAVRDVRWRLAHPGHARLLSGVARMEKKSPKGGFTGQQVLEELGYKFPPGCYFVAAPGGSWAAAHYPLMLKRFEKELDLEPVDQMKVPETRSEGSSKVTAPDAASPPGSNFPAPLARPP